jgi:hypothetical protein
MTSTSMTSTSMTSTSMTSENVNKPKMNIVLDLDETLIGGFFQVSKLKDESDSDNDNDNDNVNDNDNDNNNDNDNDIFLGVGNLKMFHRYRPHLVEFIDYIKERYNIYIYTNGNKSHYDNFIKNIKGLINFTVKGCSYRNDSFYEEIPLKTLEKFELSPHDTIIIDDNKNAWSEKYREYIIKIPIFCVDIRDKSRKYIYDSHLKTIMCELEKLNLETEIDVKKFVDSVNEIFMNSSSKSINKEID